MYIGTEADDIQGIKVANITLVLVAQNFLLGTRNGEKSSKVSPSKTAIELLLLTKPKQSYNGNFINSLKTLFSWFLYSI